MAPLDKFSVLDPAREARVLQDDGVEGITPFSVLDPAKLETQAESHYGIDVPPLAAADPARLEYEITNSGPPPDITAPDAPVIVSIDPAAVGGYVNSASVTFHLTAEANSTVRVYEDAVLLGTADEDSPGVFSYDATVTQGLHSYTAKATDGSNNTSVASTPLSVTIDSIAPGAPIIVKVHNNTGDHGNNTSFGNSGTVTLSGTAEANANVDVYHDGVKKITVAANGSGAWSANLSSVITFVNSHLNVMTAFAIDAAANVSVSSAAFNFTLTIIAP